MGCVLAEESEVCCSVRGVLTALEGRLCQPAHWVGQDPSNMVWEGVRNAGWTVM
ncbi:MAG: hypothetical protein HFG50_05015 [Lachnospiraceae bacterium]|nr:hypothetical protein [Lachnospiraceae bacterium]